MPGPRSVDATDEECGEAEKGEKAGEIGGGGELDAAGEGGVLAQSIHAHGDEDAGDDADDDVGEQREGDDATEPGIALPDDGDATNKEAGEEADDGTTGELVTGDGESVTQFEAAEGERSDDDGERLDAGVAAHATDDGEEGCEHGDAGEGVFERGDHPGGGEHGDEVHGEPGEAMADGAPDAAEIFFFADADHAEHVLGGFVFEDVQQVIVGEGADDVALFVDDGEGEQFVLLEDAGGVLLVAVDADGDGVGDHEAVGAGGGGGGDQGAEVEYTSEGAFVLADVEVEGLRDIERGVAELSENLIDSCFGGDGDELSGHAAAGRVLVVDKEGVDRFAAFGREGVQYFFGGLVRERLDDISGDVVVFEVEGFGDLICGELREQLAPEVGFHVVKGVRGGLGVECEQDLGASIVVEVFECVGEFGAVQFMREREGGGEVVELEEVLEGGRGGLGLLGRLLVGRRCSHGRSFELSLAT